MPEHFSSMDWEEDILIGCLIHEDSNAHFFSCSNAGTDAGDFGLPQTLPGRWHQPFSKKAVAIVKPPPPVPHSAGDYTDRCQTDFSQTL